MKKIIKPEKHFWFLNTFVTIRISETEGNDGISILEHRAPYDDSPPQHIHHNEDEIFQILEGEFLIKIGEKKQLYNTGDVIMAPKGVAHTYRVQSKNGGRWITVTAHKDFEKFVREISRPAAALELPPPNKAPSLEEIKKLTDIAAKFGIEITGPPLH